MQRTKKQFSPIAKLVILIAVVAIPAFSYVMLTALGDVSINKTITSNPDLKSGLVGHWTFDGKDLTPNARDISGNGNHGNLAGFTSTTTVPGKIGQALEFDGSDDNIGIPDTNDIFDFGTASTANFSIVAWMKTTDTCNGEVFLSRYTSSTGWNLSCWSGLPNMIVRDSNSVSGGTGNGTTLINDGQWHFIVGVIRNGSSYLYVDGVQEASGGGSFTGNFNTTVNVNIGNHGSDDRFFNGKIDDVRIYNRALSAEEITRLYQLGGTTRINKTITSNPDLSSGLVGHWTFDGKDLTPNARDISGNGNHGNLAGFTSTTTRPGKIGQSLEFDGVDDYVHVENESNFDITGNITVSAWIYVSAKTGSTQRFVGKRTGGVSGSAYTLQYNQGSVNKFRWQVCVSGTCYNADSDADITVGEWIFLTGVYNGSSSTIYRDAIAQIDQETVTGSINTNNDPLLIGASSNVTVPIGEFVHGKIDDVRIYNRALSAEEITRLYQLGGTTRINKTITSNPDLKSGLVGHWTFDGKDLTPNARDISGNGNHGNLAGFTSTTTVPGKIGQALEFGNNLSTSKIYVDISGGAGSSWDVVGDAVTISAWHRPDSGNSSGQRIVSKSSTDDSDDYSIMYYVSGNNRYRFRIRTSTLTELNLNDISLNANGTWRHIVGVYDGVNMILYVNGTQRTSTPKTGILANGGLTDLFIGANRGLTATRMHDGAIDEVRIYNRALSAEEVKKLYELGN